MAFLPHTPNENLLVNREAEKHKMELDTTRTCHIHLIITLLERLGKNEFSVQMWTFPIT